MYTILVADDNPSNLGVITECLEERGYKAAVATDGEIALQRAIYVHPDLILLDILMPGIDGFETCRRLKAEEETRDIPIIFMTALTSAEDKMKGFQAGAVDYVTKPIQSGEVLARVATHLRIRDLMQSLHKQKAALIQANSEICLLNERLRRENIEVKADLQESEQKYKMLVEQISEGHFVLQDECFVFVNQTFCDMHGYPAEELAGKHFSICVAPESLKEVQNLYEESRSPETLSHLFEYMRLTRKQQGLPTEMAMKTLYHEEKRITLGICRDISARLEMERKMRETERMTQIGKITTSLSHEIRNPLSAIKMHLQMLEEYMPMFDDGAQLNLTLSIREVTRLEKSLGQLLDFAKPLRLEIESCYLNQILSSCIDLCRVQFEQKELEISCSCDPVMGCIQADREKFLQVIMNLLLNAFEASPQNGKIWITTRDRSHEQPPAYEMTIEDEGPGISEQDMQQMFEPFFTRKKRGTGLGLTNARHIVEAHGGRIAAANRHSGGAFFSVWLPA